MGGQESCTEPHRGVANDGHPRNFTRAVKFLWISRQILSVCRDDRTLSFPLERARLALALKRNPTRHRVPPVFKAVDSRIPTGVSRDAVSVSNAPVGPGAGAVVGLFQFHKPRARASRSSL